MNAALARVADERHSLIVLDDLQWSDDATLDLLAALAEPLRRMLAAGGGRLPVGRPPARPHAAAPASRARRSGRLEELTLGPLDEDETGELLAGVLGGAPAPSLTRAIHDRTQGLPFFIEELARALR